MIKGSEPGERTNIFRHPSSKEFTSWNYHVKNIKYQWIFRMKECMSQSWTREAEPVGYVQSCSPSCCCSGYRSHSLHYPPLSPLLECLPYRFWTFLASMAASPNPQGRNAGSKVHGVAQTPHSWVEAIVPR